MGLLGTPKRKWQLVYNFHPFYLFSSSPSDLEADLEDNQDYDSTVSQSDSNLTLIGHSSSAEYYQAPKVPDRTYQKSFDSQIVSSKTDFRQKENVSPSRNSVLSRYRTEETESESTYSRTSRPRSPKSPKSPRQTNQPTDIVREPYRPVSSVLARYKPQEPKQDGPVGYRSRFNEREVQAVRGPIAASLFNKDSRVDDAAKKKLEKVCGYEVYFSH